MVPNADTVFQIVLGSADSAQARITLTRPCKVLSMDAQLTTQTFDAANIFDALATVSPDLNRAEAKNSDMRLHLLFKSMIVVRHDP